jgi:hypothetical protein
VKFFLFTMDKADARSASLKTFEKTSIPWTLVLRPKRPQNPSVFAKFSRANLSKKLAQDPGEPEPTARPILILQERARSER